MKSFPVKILPVCNSDFSNDADFHVIPICLNLHDLCQFRDLICAGNDSADAWAQLVIWSIRQNQKTCLN